MPEPTHSSSRDTRRSPCRPTALLRLGLFASALAILGCNNQPPRPDPIDNVVVVLIDALRFDHLGCYGYERPTSPRIDALSASATTFMQTVSPAPWTLPVMATMWTSLYPSVHGAARPSNLHVWARDRENFRPSRVLDPSRTTLAESLRDAGFATAAFIDGSYPSTLFGTPQGFDLIVQDEAEGSRLNVEQVLAWLDRDKPERFFAYLHIGEVHSPYLGPNLNRKWLLGDEERKAYVRRANFHERKRYRRSHFDPKYNGPISGARPVVDELARTRRKLAARDLEHLIAAYDSGIAYVDGWVGRLIDALDKRQLSENTVFIVTSDHGDEFYDHKGYEHSITYYEEMVRVPLIIRAPGIGKPRRVDRQVGLIDLTPTVLDLTGVSSDAPMQGVSLLPLITGGDIQPRTLFAEASMSGRWKAAARTVDEKFILADKPERNHLYDLNKDPREQINLCRSAPARCQQWQEIVEEWQADNKSVADTLALPTAAPVELDSTTRERLRALGYDE